MKQKLFLIMICLLGISNVYTQISAPTERSTSAILEVSPVKIIGKQFKAPGTDGFFYYGFCDNTINTDLGGLGAPAVQALSAAIYLPGNTYAGKTISKIRFALLASCTNVSVWIRSSLTGADLVSQVVSNPVNMDWTEVTLSTPFPIPTGDIYIGYTATGYYPLGVSGTSANDGCWFNNGSGWQNLVSSYLGSFCIQAGIDLQGMNVFGAKPENLPQSVQSNPNQNMYSLCYIRNYSNVDITSVKLSYQIDNQTPVSNTLSISIASLKSGSVSIPINAIASTGIYNLSVKILEVNGQPNSLANESLSSQIKILSQWFPRKVVMEEGTGIWCGYCPRGAVGMETMKQKYPNTFIGIAVHHEENFRPDPMAVPDYDNFMNSNFFTGFPDGVIDRKTNLKGDPYYCNYNYMSEIAMIPLAGIQLTGGFTDADKNAISLKTVTTFGISSNNANFKLAYVLIENGVTGYSQRNYYSGGSSAMGGYENKPDPVTDMVFNDVARGIYSDPTGISGSIPSPITALTPINNNYTISLPSSIQNKNQLEVAVLLINGNTGEIENADKIEITGIYTTKEYTWNPRNLSSDWNDPNNWTPTGVPDANSIVTIPGPDKVTNFPDLNYVPAATAGDGAPGPGGDTGSSAAPVATVSEIHFAPGAELGGQDLLQYNKAFVQLDFSAPASRNRWWMLTNPLQQMFAGDLLFGGSPGVAIQSFVTGTDGVNAWKTFTDGFGHQFGQGDCFEIWLGTTNKPNQGLSVSSGIITLPYFEDPAQAAVHPTHIYDPNTKKSTFNNGTTSPIISVDRDPIAAYKLADGTVTKNLIFGKGTDQFYYAATGNPFMSSISFKKLQSTNSSLINSRGYWVWVGPATSSTPTPGGYANYNAATGYTVGNIKFGDLNDTIPPMQSFIVERNATSTGALITFNITNTGATRKNKSTVGLREAAQSNDLLEITASAQQSAVCAVIASREGGSLMFNDLDSRKIFTDINVSPDIYMLKQSANNGMVAVAADILNDIKEDVVIPLGISTAYEGSITFTFAGMDTYNARIFLIDNAAPDKKEIELTGKAKYEYTFSYAPEKVNDTAVRNESRFAVRLSPTGVTGIESAAADNILVFSRSAGTVQAISGEVIKQITVIDMQGRKIHDNPSLSTNEYTVTGLAAGVYVVKAVTGNEVKTTKVIVK